MASSNRHWPSMFKSKPCNPTTHQWQHDINSSLLSTGCHRTPYTSVPGIEERCPEPKPRWNPKPEQIRILEGIFNSGMVNPPRDEIRKIRAQLQVYGQVGDANVFYWFQNRKSRSKHKLQRQLHNNKSRPTTTAAAGAGAGAGTGTTPSSSSSSSSEKSSPKSAFSPPGFLTTQPYFPTPAEFSPEPYFFPVQQTTAGAGAGGGCFSELSSVVHAHGDNQTVGNCSGFLLSDLLMMNHGPLMKEDDHKMMMMMKLEEQVSYSATATHATIPPHVTTTTTTTTTATVTTPTIVPPVTVSVPSTVNHIQGAGVGESGALVAVHPARSTVFINDVAFDVSVGPFNVREAFGDDAVLIHSTGHPLLTNEWGVTLHPLQHGAFYYLI